VKQLGRWSPVHHGPQVDASPVDGKSSVDSYTSEWSEKPGDGQDETIVSDLAEVYALRQSSPICHHFLPGETEPSMMQIDYAGSNHPRSQITAQEILNMFVQTLYSPNKYRRI